MECPECGGDQLYGLVTVTVPLPLAKRGGSVKAGGQSFSAVTLKDVWDTGSIGGSRIGAKTKFKAPIRCADCGTECVYVVGAPHNPYVGTVAEAERKGIRFFKDGGFLPGDPRAEG